MNHNNLDLERVRILIFHLAVVSSVQGRYNNTVRSVPHWFLVRVILVHLEERVPRRYHPARTDAHNIYPRFQEAFHVTIFKSLRNGQYNMYLYMYRERGTH